jgi:hypothetical protein
VNGHNLLTGLGIPDYYARFSFLARLRARFLRVNAIERQSGAGKFDALETYWFCFAQIRRVDFDHFQE